MWDLLQSLSSVPTLTQSMGGRAWAQRWLPGIVEVLLAGTWEQGLSWLSSFPSSQPWGLATASWPSLFHEEDGIHHSPIVLTAVPMASKPTSATSMASAVCYVLKAHSVMINFLRYFLRTSSRTRVCRVYLSVFSQLTFDCQRELINISMSVRTAGSRTSYRNFLESIQFPESSHQTSSKCHPWFTSFRNLLLLCV